MNNPTAITDTLYVGAYPSPAWLATEGRRFSIVAFCALEPPLGKSPRYLHVALTDDDMILKHSAPRYRAAAAAKRILKAEGPALCVCAAGRNRSAFVAALALVMSGVPPNAAIGQVRRKRELELGESVLFNKAFVHLLRTWPNWESQ